MKISALLALSVLMTLPVAAQSCYAQRNLVSNRPDFAPQIVDPLVVNAWGLSLRPAGLGGHWWVANTDTGTSTLYVGDTETTPLFQDGLKVVTVAAPLGASASTPTGQVFSGSTTDFIVSGEGVTGPSRFMWVTEDGTISGWAERLNPDGTFTRMTTSVITVNRGPKGAYYKGLAVTDYPEGGNYLYAANFGQRQVEVYDGAFKRVRWLWSGGRPRRPFQQPGTIPADFAPFGVQYIAATQKVYVTYAKVTEDPNTEEQGAGLGYVAEFGPKGQLVRVLEHSERLNAPWGVVLAPADFGSLSGKLLVGNFGGGAIVAFDLVTGLQTGYLLNTQGETARVDGLWGLSFGNGQSLGRSNYLYFAAGPNEEADGLFGSLNEVACPKP